ncbi:hypothetical protein NL676_007363 [Syzygium grande]|nr:hypothetical protein NL676_007363 [Syzygium grande]
MAQKAIRPMTMSSRNPSTRLWLATPPAATMAARASAISTSNEMRQISLCHQDTRVSSRDEKDRKLAEWTSLDISGRLKRQQPSGGDSLLDAPVQITVLAWRPQPCHAQHCFTIATSDTSCILASHATPLLAASA